MRMAGAIALLVLAVEVLVGLGFLAGWYWVGELRGGLIVGGAVLLLIVLPWLGELTVRFDSAGPAGAFKVSWWGRFSFRETPEASQFCVRVLGIPFRREKSKLTPEAPPETGAAGEPAPAPAEAEVDEAAEAPGPAERTKAANFARRVNVDTIEGVTRMALAGLAAANDLVWGAREITIRLDDMTEHEVADRALRRVFGARAAGPLDLLVMTGDGRRRVRLRYRIGLLRVAMNAVQVFVEGQPLRLKTAMAQAEEKSEDVSHGEDEALIRAIQDARKDE